MYKKILLILLCTYGYTHSMDPIYAHPTTDSNPFVGLKYSSEIRPMQQDRIEHFAHRHDLSPENEALLVNLFESINALNLDEQRRIQKALHEFTRLTPIQQKDSLERLQERAAGLEEHRVLTKNELIGRHFNPSGIAYQDPFVNTYNDTHELLFILNLLNTLVQVRHSLSSQSAGSMATGSSIDLGKLVSLFA